MSGSPLRVDNFADALTDAVPEIKQLADLDSYTICALDSSDMGPKQWSELARKIAQGRDHYDGFVIIHGTDTMAYTASALTFALRGLDRPVILTGAQRPLASVRTDARRNLVDAVELATYDIPEVGICFDGFLFRGCRTTKNNGLDYRAFESMGCPPLATLGVHVEVSDHIKKPNAPFQCDARFDRDVLVLHITPALNPMLLESMLEHAQDLRGLVVVAFGLGNIPTATNPLAPVFARLMAQEIDVVVVTQSMGEVDMKLYANGKDLAESGAISGGKMGVEAATTKLMHALAVYKDREERRRYLEWNVAGERE